MDDSASEKCKWKRSKEGWSISLLRCTHCRGKAAITLKGFFGLILEAPRRQRRESC